ncbi:MAG: fatty acid--CoA ligase, partial [Gemmatimonadetes bacterium]
MADVETGHLAALFARAAREHPEREFVVFGSRRMTYGQVEREAVALAESLASLGLQTGDRLAVDLPNWPEWVVTLLAAA